MRGGGLGGLVRTSTADTARLSRRDSQQLAALVEQAGLTGGPVAQPAEPGPDQFSYAVSVEDQGLTRQARFSERSMPREVRNLISWVTSASGRDDDTEPPSGRPHP